MFDDLTVEEREVLARLEMLAQGSTQRFDASGGGGEPDLPFGIGADGSGAPDSEYPHLHWRTRILGARNDYSRHKALEGARAELEGWRQRVVWTNSTIETWAELVDRIVGEGSGWSVREVANHCRCSERQVVKARNEAGLSVDKGQALDGHRGSVYAYKQGCRCSNCRAVWAQKAWARRNPRAEAA